jgi:hypothetical protein
MRTIWKTRAAPRKKSVGSCFLHGGNGILTGFSIFRYAGKKEYGILAAS